jgi:hypothetical protein
MARAAPPLERMITEVHSFLEILAKSEAHDREAGWGERLRHT